MSESLRRLVVYTNDFKKYIINDKSFVKYNEYFYVFDDAVVKKKLIEKHHNDLLSEYFET